MTLNKLIEKAKQGATLRDVLEKAYGKPAEEIGVEGQELSEYQHDLDAKISRIYAAQDAPGTVVLVAGSTIWQDCQTMNVVTSIDEEQTEEFERDWALIYPVERTCKS